MKVEIEPKRELDKKIEKYELYPDYYRYKEEVDLFYRNFVEVLSKKIYKNGDKKEINKDVKDINRASEEKIKNTGGCPRCTIMICDNEYFFEEEFLGNFDDFPKRSFRKLKNYSTSKIFTRIGIQLTCVDTRYKPLTLGYILTK